MEWSESTNKHLYGMYNYIIYQQIIVQMQLYSGEVKVGIYQDKQELMWAYVEKGSDPYGKIYSWV